jgi:hypothetical protein
VGAARTPATNAGASARWIAGPRAGGLANQMVAFGDVRGSTGGLGVRRGGGGQVAAQLVQVAADGVPACRSPMTSRNRSVSRSPAAAPRTRPTAAGSPGAAAAQRVALQFGVR